MSNNTHRVDLLAGLIAIAFFVPSVSCASYFLHQDAMAQGNGGFMKQIDGNGVPNNSSLSDPDTLSENGKKLFAGGKYEEAISYFDKALKMDPNFVEVLNIALPN